MSETMVREKGHLNYAQARLLLDVSTKRISELVRLGKINRFDFLGRTYVSVREVGERYQQELKAGRSRRAVGKRVVASIKAEALCRRSYWTGLNRLCKACCARPRRRPIETYKTQS
jgi:hypothetical protein